MNARSKLFQSVALAFLVCLIVCLLPDVAMAQATDPFETGASNLQVALMTLLTPVAALLVMGLGVAAAAGRVSWGWPLGVLVGVGVIFAAPTIVSWIRGLFAA